MLALFALLGLFDTFGDAHSYTRTSANGRYVLVMLVPGSVESDISGLNARATEAVTAIRGTYKSSGLYRVEDSTLLWSMPEFESDAVVASDGEHVVGYR